MKKVRAIILAGGKGNRLDVFGTPKPLVRVGRRALISRAVGMLQTAGIKDITIIIQDDAALVESFIIKKFGKTNTVRIVKQEKNNESELGAFLSIESSDAMQTLVTACDLVFEKNAIKKFLSKPLKEGQTRALISADNKLNDMSGANMQALCTNDKVVSIGPEVRQRSGLLTGVYFFSKVSLQDFKRHAKSEKKDTSPGFIFNLLAREGRLEQHILGNNEWHDVNTPEDLLRAELLIQRIVAKSLSLPVKKKTNKLNEIKPTTTFINKKRLKTEIIIERGVLNKLSTISILPKGFEASTHFIITDKKVDRLYGSTLQSDLQKQGWNIKKIIVEEGEGVKAIETYAHLAQELLEQGIDKKSLIISLGGGAVNNIAGFLAATLYRGIGLIHIPTTLLAQDDAAIGIKQGVNGPKGKNLLGAKYSPLRIIVDPNVLATLSERQVRDGLNECIKHAFAQDKTFYRYLINYSGSMMSIRFLEKIVRKNIELKIALMEDDFDEERHALVLLYGHEVGHAIEYLSGFKYGHGEAVALGMRVSAELAQLLGVAKKSVLEQHKVLFNKYKINITIPKNIEITAIINMLRYDKKFHGGDAYFSLVDTIGHLWNVNGKYLIPVKENIIKQAIEKSYEK